MDLYKKTCSATFREGAAYHDKLGDRLNKQRHKEKYCDIKLSVTGQVFHAHKLILASYSPYFDTMFCGRFQEHDEKNIDLSNVFDSGETLDLLLTFMYTGNITLTEENCTEVLNGAAHFLMENLRSNCAQFLLNNLGPSNCLRLWAIADMYDLTELQHVCASIARARFHDYIAHQQESLEIPSFSLKRLIATDALDFMRPEEKMNFLIKWIDFNAEEREPQLRAMLSESQIARKIGLYRLNLDSQEKNEQDHTHGTALKDLLEAASFEAAEEAPELDELNEALVGWHHKHIPEGMTRVLHLYAYLPQANRWWTLGKIRIDRYFGNFLGFVERQFLFRTNNGFLVVNSERNTFYRVGIPALQRTSGIRSYSLFVFDGCAFCIMEISKYIRRRLTNGSHFLIPEARAFLKVYNFSTRSWEKVNDLPVPKQIAWLPLQFHVLPREDLKCVFVLAMSCANSMHVRGPGDEWRINGPFLMSVKKRRTKFWVQRLQDPPVNRHDLPGSLHSLRLLGTSDKIYVYGTNQTVTEHQEECTPLLSYDITGGNWTVEDDRVLLFPQVERNCFVGVEERIPKPPGVNGVLSLERGLVYRMKSVTPFITQFWAADIEDIEDIIVNELTPPPTEKITNFMACYVPRDLLEGQSKYRDTSVKKGKSPLSAARLISTDHAGWTWQFNAGPTAPSSALVAQSSSSDIDIDVVS